MTFISCSGNLVIDSNNRAKCADGWVTHTTEQLAQEIALNGNYGLTPEMYLSLSTAMALILIAAFGWRAAYQVINDNKGEGNV